jgi:hypothetical protein
MMSRLASLTLPEVIAIDAIIAIIAVTAALLRRSFP